MLTTLTPSLRQASLTAARYAVVTLILLGFVTTAMGDVPRSFTTAMPPVHGAGWGASPSIAPLYEKPVFFQAPATTCGWKSIPLTAPTGCAWPKRWSPKRAKAS